MPKAMDFIQFKKLVKYYNLRILTLTKHRSAVVDEEGNVIIHFSITHQKGSKDFIKTAYTSLFEKKIKDLGFKKKG